MSQSQGGNTSSSNTHTLNSSERDPHKNSWARMLLGMGMGCHNCYTKEKKSSDSQFLSHRFSCNPWWELYEEKQQQDFGLGMQQNALIMTTLCNRDIPKDIRQHHLLLVCDIEGWWHMQANWNESLSILWQTTKKIGWSHEKTRAYSTQRESGEQKWMTYWLKLTPVTQGHWIDVEKRELLHWCTIYCLFKISLLVLKSMVMEACLDMSIHSFTSL